MSSSLPFAAWYERRLRRERHAEARRWGASLLGVLAVSGCAVWWCARQPAPVVPPVQPPPSAIAIDLAPEPTAAPTPPTDAPAGPQQTQSHATPLPDPPPKITAPPAPAPRPPVPVPKPEKQRRVPRKPQPAPSDRHPTPDILPPSRATSAPPTTQAPPARTQAAAAPGAAATQSSRTPASWQSALLAQLEKFKRYPPDAMADHEEGTPTVTFTMDRSGHVLSARLANSSGNAQLDQEALALPRRAQPLPIPPATVEGSTITLTAPVEFYIHE